MRDNNHGSVATYVIIALILGAITYIEFAIVEYTFSWLSRGAVMFWLVLLSVIKFVLVVMFFMHLKEDDKLYTGFFGSGMLLALGTFIGLIFLFTVASTTNFTFTNQSPEPSEVVADAPRTTVPPADPAARIVPPAAQPADDFVLGAEADGPAPEAGPFDAAAAETAYTSNCAACHQATGAGLPGLFPPLADHVDDIISEGGRDVVKHIVMFGLAGQIEVHGSTYNGVMPFWNTLSDQVLSDILNHISTAWGNADALPADFEYFTPEEIAETRSLDLSMQDVYAERSALGLD